ncbi:MAG: hypothetical protein CMF17_09370 [Idiomarinaceae bacterium]|nr:hypothetical protein [Idiomarinaceae bacterium]
MNTKAIINNLSPQEALTLLKNLAENDPQLAKRIAQMAHEHIREVDSQDVAADVYSDLDALQVEDVWDQAGSTRHGYVETQEVADEMIHNVLAPYTGDLERYKMLNMPQEALAVCMGILEGLYLFETESTNEFKDWAVDIPQSYADTTLQLWYSKEFATELVALQSFIDTNLPRWRRNLKSILASKK